jgi:hypothetical protein
MIQQFCQDCGASLMATMRMCPTCGSKNLGANPNQVAPQAKSAINNSANNNISTTFAGNQLKGLGGWLILIGFALIINPIRQIAALNSNYKPYIDTDLFAQLTSPSSSSYIPNFKTLFYAEIAVSIFIIILSFYLIYLFFSKSKKFPKNYIFISLFVILYIPIDAFLVATIVPNIDVFDGELIKSFFQALISGAIWIPYMMKSKRVNNTFIEN